MALRNVLQITFLGARVSRQELKGSGTTLQLTAGLLLEVIVLEWGISMIEGKGEGEAECMEDNSLNPGGRVRGRVNVEPFENALSVVGPGTARVESQAYSTPMLEPICRVRRAFNLWPYLSGLLSL